MPALKRPRTKREQLLHEIMSGHAQNIRDYLHNTRYSPSERKRLAKLAAGHARMVRREMLADYARRPEPKE